MKTLIVYDTNYGNTQLVAKTIGDAIGKKTNVVSVDEFEQKDLDGVDLLIVGSPINGWMPTKKTEEFLAAFHSGHLRGIKATAFDTRVQLFFHGDAAKRIAEKLSDAGAQIVKDPEGFYVQGKEGPLVAGEKEKAAQWADMIIAKVRALSSMPAL